MSDGNKLDVSKLPHQHQEKRLPFEEMGDVLLDTMQGTLVCLDSQHSIVDVSKTVKEYFGFEQTELIGLSMLLLIEDSERDAFLKFLNHPSQSNDMCRVRMMTNNPNEFHLVKIHRKRKVNQDNVDVHSTTPRHSCSVRTILIITIENSSYIGITLYDIYKPEFYTKMNLMGEIIFEDHRGASITGYLPHEVVSQSIFNLVHPDDRLVKLHALWKCVTAGSSKLQWRFNARDGSSVFLQTEYKLITDDQNHVIIIARNEVLSPAQISQFDELQAAWKYQCAADIKGHNASFKLISSSDRDLSSISEGECCISVPSLSMCFTTNKLQPLTLQGNIFDVSKSTRPLTIQDYINILIVNDKHIDTELSQIITNIQSLTARYQRLNESGKPQANSEPKADEKSQSRPSLPSNDSPRPRKHDRDSIVRGLLSNSIKYDHEKPSGEPLVTSDQLSNGNGNGNANNNSNGNSRPVIPAQVQSNPTPPSAETLHQVNVDFLKKYTTARAKLESQLESFNRLQTCDTNKRNTLLKKLFQLEYIKNKQLAQQHDLNCHATVEPVHNPSDNSPAPFRNHHPHNNHTYPY